MDDCCRSVRRRPACRGLEAAAGEPPRERRRSRPGSTCSSRSCERCVGGGDMNPSNGLRPDSRAPAPPCRRRRVRGDPRALEDALDRRGQPRSPGPHLDADRGLRLRGDGHRRSLGGARGCGTLLHRAPHRLPRHPLRPRVHRDRAAGRMRGGTRDGDARGALARSTSRRASASSGATRSSFRGIRLRRSSAARRSTPTSPSRTPSRRRLQPWPRRAAGSRPADAARLPRTRRRPPG